MLATVTFQLAEPSTITGVDIGNYRSCVVIVTASTSSDPDTWLPIVQHQFMRNDEAADGKFKDQVQLFTKKELNPDKIKTKFDRIKVTCMQSANLKELFGLMFFIAKTEVMVDLGLDVFGRFKLKQKEENDGKPPVDEFKEKYLKMMAKKKAELNSKDDLLKKAKESSMLAFSKRQEENREPMKRPLLKKLEAGKAEEVFGNQNKTPESNKYELTTDIAIANATGMEDKRNENVMRTPFGDIIPSPTSKKNSNDNVETKKRSLTSEEKNTQKKVKKECPKCSIESDDKPCATCGRLAQPIPLPSSITKVTKNKPKKLFSQLLQNITFSLSGYVNPQRDEIRRKALKMGATYIANPNTSNNLCTHLICAFANTPKFQQLKDHSKIVSHKFIEDCYNEKKRLPWRRYAMDKKEKKKPESEDEIEADESPQRTPNPFEEDTDSETYY